MNKSILLSDGWLFLIISNDSNSILKVVTLFNITVHSRRDGHSINKNVCGMWEAKAEVQVSREEFFFFFFTEKLEGESFKYIYT